MSVAFCGMGVEPTQDQKKAAFSVAAMDVLREMQRGLSDILDSLPENLTRPQEYSRHLKIDKQLAWRVVKIARGTDPFAAGQHVPGQAAMRTFLKAAERVSTPPEIVARASRAYADFEELVQVHAGGDRATLEMMLTSKARKDRQTADLSHRRLAFRGNSYIWGVQAKAHLKVGIVRPSEKNEGKIDFALINGFFGFRQLREGAPLTAARIKSSEYDESGRRLFTYEPIGPGVEVAAGVHVMEEFCSQPLPEFVALESDRGFQNYEIRGRGIGDTFAVNFVEGCVVRGEASRYGDEHNLYGENCANICIPTETLVVDFLIREDTFGPLEPISLVFGENLRKTYYPALNRDRDLLDIHEPVVHLGRGTSVLHSDNIPRYPAMGRFVFDQLGWDADRFDVYRCELQYPVVPSTVVMRHDLPKAPRK